MFRKQKESKSIWYVHDDGCPKTSGTLRREKNDNKWSIDDEMKNVRGNKVLKEEKERYETRKKFEEIEARKKFEEIEARNKQREKEYKEREKECKEREARNKQREKEYKEHFKNIEKLKEQLNNFDLSNQTSTSGYKSPSL